MKSLIDNVSRIWCVMLHSDLMWPIHGHYCCRRCLRQYRIRWNAEEQSFAAASRPSSERVSILDICSQ
jgi:hypothetical protein